VVPFGIQDRGFGVIGDAGLRSRSSICQAAARMIEPSGPSRIKLSDGRRDRIVRSLRVFFASELEEEISDFQARLVLDFFLRELGAPVYNQAIQDARGFVQEKLADLEGEFYEPDEGSSSAHDER
jgi:uncharacterized protein (DUF2164 family)